MCRDSAGLSCAAPCWLDPWFRLDGTMLVESNMPIKEVIEIP